MCETASCPAADSCAQSSCSLRVKGCPAASGPPVHPRSGWERCSTLVILVRMSSTRWPLGSGSVCSHWLRMVQPLGKHRHSSFMECRSAVATSANWIARCPLIIYPFLLNGLKRTMSTRSRGPKRARTTAGISPDALGFRFWMLSALGRWDTHRQMASRVRLHPSHLQVPLIEPLPRPSSG